MQPPRPGLGPVSSHGPRPHRAARVPGGESWKLEDAAVPSQEPREGWPGRAGLGAVEGRQVTFIHMLDVVSRFQA